MAYTTVLAVVILRLKAILEKIGNAEEKNEIANSNEWIYLPIDLLPLVLSRLSLKDNIRASSVCKAWHEAAISVRCNSSWFVYFDIDLTGVSYGFFDPTEKKKTKAMKLPYPSFFTGLRYSTNGWVLMVDYFGPIKRLILFNPFTRVHITLPSLIAIGTFEAEYAFSCNPTDKNCVVCCISNRTPSRLLIHTWYVSAAEWVTEVFHKPPPSRFIRRNNIIFYDGYFWFPHLDGLGVFDPIARMWDTLCVPLPNLTSDLMWITEYKGNMFLVNVVILRRVVLFRLNRSRLVWEKTETFDGLSIFISDESNIMTNGLTGDMSNIVYVWGFHFIPDRLSKFSLHTGSFCTHQDGYCVDSSTNNEILHFGAWIEPPQDSHIYKFPIIEPK